MDTNTILQNFFVFVGILGNIILGIFTYLKNPKSATNRFFLYFTITLSFYIGINAVSTIQTIDELAFFWIRVVMTIALILNCSFFLLMVTFPSNKDLLSWKIKFILFIFTLALFPVTMTHLIFSSVQVIDGMIKTSPGLGMPLFLLHTLATLGGGFLFLWKKLRNAQGTQRKQIRMVFLGTFLMFASILITNVFFVVVFNITKFVSLVPLYTLIFVGCVSYAIVRHKFLDINIFIVRAVTYFFMIFFVAFLYSFIILFLGKFLFGIVLQRDQQIVLLFFTILIALSFQKIKKSFEKLTSRILFKETYDLDQAIAQVTNITTSTIVLSDLVESMMMELKNILKVSAIAVIIPRPNNFSKYALPSDFLSSFNIRDFSLFEKRSLSIFDDLDESELKDYMRDNKIGCIAPCKTKDECIAYIFFGIKNSGESYPDQDIKFIQIISNESAVAIRNAQSYEEIKNFNKMLKQQIEEATKELKSTNKRLQELDKLKDEFVSVAAHELRTPMAAIKGSISTILEGYAGEISDQAREFLTAAYNENERLIRIVNNLLNTSRIDSGKLSFNIGSIDIQKLISDVVKNLQFAAKEKNIYLEYEVKESLPLVMADDDKLREVVINLVGNAIKFTSSGGVVIRSCTDGDFVVTSVQDTGTGIHKEHFDLLFKKYSQLKTDYTKTIGGTGLGLYICKRIVEDLGGKIWLDSEVGKGSTFYFSLPIAK
ncbi:MAG: ATP-binding protein [Patescibacteria group bacterium]|nr:ATP-binding protein [Patescibacteria group bacterium]